MILALILRVAPQMEQICLVGIRIEEALEVALRVLIHHVVLLDDIFELIRIASLIELLLLYFISLLKNVIVQKWRTGALNIGSGTTKKPSATIFGLSVLKVSEAGERCFLLLEVMLLGHWRQ